MWSGYPEIFSFSQALEMFRQYLLFQTVILQKKSRWVPMSEMEFLKLGTRSKKGGSTESHFNSFIVIFLSTIILMVFTVTSSDCKVKKARFYELLFTLG